MEDSGQIRLAAAQETQGIGMISCLLKGTDERIVGDIEVVVGQVDFLAQQRFARDALDLTVDDALDTIWVAEDPLDRVNMRLEELVHDVGMLIEECLAD